MSDASGSPTIAPPPLRTGLPPPPAPRSSWLVPTLIVGAGALGALVLLLVVGAWWGGSASGITGGSIRRGAGELMEVVLERRQSPHKVAVIPLQGIIGSSLRSADGEGLPGLIRDQLERIARDAAVRAVVLRVDSPGGEVLASDEIHNALQHFQTNHGIPIVASMGSLAASGGYYVSAPCRWIVAHPLTLTGSIGVIFHGYNYRSLMDKVGVRPDVVKSGRLKDMFSGELRPDEELPEEKAILRELVSESFQRFKQVVREGRAEAQRRNTAGAGEPGRALAANWEEFADGRILSGNQAYDLGLVDELGGLETALDRARVLAGIPHASVVSYQSPARLGDLFPFLGVTARDPVAVRLEGFPGLPALPEGRLLFLSPLHAR